MTTEKHDELSALAAQAEGLETAQDAAQQGQGEPQQAAPVQTNAQLLAGTFQLAREVGCVVAGVNSPRVVLDDATLTQLGDAWGAVADKRGWDLAKLMGDYAAEVSAVMLTVAVLSKVAKGVQNELAAREREAAEVKPVPVAEAA